MSPLLALLLASALAVTLPMMAKKYWHLLITTLVAAVQAADLVDTLSSDGPFTVFAPTDEAFGKLPAGTVESLLKPENREQLVRILTYHVVSGRIYAKDALSAGTAKTAGTKYIVTLSTSA